MPYLDDGHLFRSRRSAGSTERYHVLIVETDGRFRLQQRGTTRGFAFTERDKNERTTSQAQLDSSRSMIPKIKVRVVCNSLLRMQPWQLNDPRTVLLPRLRREEGSVRPLNSSFPRSRMKVCNFLRWSGATPRHQLLALHASLSTPGSVSNVTTATNSKDGVLKIVNEPRTPCLRHH